VQFFSDDSDDTIVYTHDDRSAHSLTVCQQPTVA